MRICFCVIITIIVALQGIFETDGGEIKSGRRSKRQENTWSWPTNPNNETTTRRDRPGKKLWFAYGRPIESDEPIKSPCDRELPHKPDLNKKGARISQIKCAEYVWDLHIEKEIKKRRDDCDAFYNIHHILGGRVARPGEFPHIVAIGWRALNGDYKFQCGGTLISQKFVLTAGHCTYAPRNTDIINSVPEVVRFTTGSLEMEQGSQYPFDVPILNITKHPSYSPPSKYYDIAIIELERQVPLSKYIQPACLWNHFDTSKINNTISTAGWGVVDLVSRKTSSTLQAADLDLIDSNECAELFQNSCNRLWCKLEDHQICAGKMAGGVDTCQGDSGGPLQAVINLPIDFTVKMYYVVGVTSFGFGCGRANSPGIYTRVSSFIDWIERTVWPNEIK